MISLKPSLITEHHSVSSLNDLAREASPCSRYLRPARDEDTTYTVGGNCSRVDGDKRAERIEPRSDSPDASVDQTEARNNWPSKSCLSSQAGLMNSQGLSSTPPSRPKRIRSRRNPEPLTESWAMLSQPLEGVIMCAYDEPSIPSRWQHA